MLNQSNIPSPRKGGEGGGYVTQMTAASQAKPFGFPVESLPGKVRDIVKIMAGKQGFKDCYTATAMLSAAAGAIGNKCSLGAMAGWKVPASLYFLVVGKAGWGKTPPMKWAYEPLMAINNRLLADYNVQLTDYLAEEQARALQGEDKVNPAAPRQRQPQLRMAMVNDATTEALKKALHDNPDGVADLYDEIMGWFSGTATASSSLVEDLLSIYSGSPLIINRVSYDKPISIPRPCLNLIGGIQTERLPELVDHGMVKNGFLDRFMMAYPTDTRADFRALSSDDDCRQVEGLREEWDAIIRRIYDMRLAPDYRPEMRISDEAAEMFNIWWEAVVEEYNGMGRSASARTMKRNGNVFRLALVIQVLRWAMGEAALDEVDLDTMCCAIDLNEHYEECYDRCMRDSRQSQDDNSPEFMVLGSMPDEFTTADYIGESVGMRIAARTAHRYLKSLVDMGIVERLGKGQFKKLSVTQQIA